MTTPQELLRGVVHCERREHLQERLRRGERLRIKFGIDPSAPDLHLGHLVPVGLLRRWQHAGHLPVLVVGDFTARIGDPSGRSATRPQLSEDEVEANAQTYLEQLSLLVETAECEVRRQSEWYEDFDLSRVLGLARSATVAQLLQRSDFEQRVQREQAVGVEELFYPLLQGYDSVAVHADVELGGSDQLFNLLQGRHVQQAYGQPAQDIVTVPLLEGLDGERKMSKSLGNAVAVAAPPDEQFGQLMSLPDQLIVRYLELLTDIPQERLRGLEAALSDGSLNPRDAKAEMAEQVVGRLHHGEAAREAREEFFRVHRDGALPAGMAQGRLPALGAWDVRDLLVACGVAASRGEAARLVSARGVRLRGEVVLGWRERVVVSEGDVLQVGRRRAMRLVQGAPGVLE